MARVAKWAGVCHGCGCAFDAGDEIKRHGGGWGHYHSADCDDARAVADSRAEQLAEMRMESWADHRMAGTTEHFWSDWEYERADFERGW